MNPCDRPDGVAPVEPSPPDDAPPWPHLAALDDRGPAPRSGFRWWHALGIVLTIALVLSALFVLAMIALLWIGMANFGSNK